MFIVLCNLFNNSLLLLYLFGMKNWKPREVELPKVTELVFSGAATKAQVLFWGCAVFLGEARERVVFGGAGGVGPEPAVRPEGWRGWKPSCGERRRPFVLPRGRHAGSPGPLGSWICHRRGRRPVLAGSADRRSVFSPIPASRSRFSCEVTSIDVSSLSPSTSGYIYIHQGN